MKKAANRRFFSCGCRAQSLTCEARLDHLDSRAIHTEVLPPDAQRRADVDHLGALIGESAKTR
jgi:hypothetical protein